MDLTRVWYQGLAKAEVYEDGLLHFYKSCILPTLFYGCEAWYDFFI